MLTRERRTVEDLQGARLMAYSVSSSEDVTSHTLKRKKKKAGQL